MAIRMRQSGARAEVARWSGEYVGVVGAACRRQFSRTSGCLSRSEAAQQRFGFRRLPTLTGFDRHWKERLRQLIRPAAPAAARRQPPTPPRSRSRTAASPSPRARTCRRAASRCCRAARATGNWSRAPPRRSASVRPWCGRGAAPRPRPRALARGSRVRPSAGCHRPDRRALAPATANAVWHATGVRVRKLRIRIEDVPT